MTVSPDVERVGGRYLLGELLGRGGMGSVYRARDELLRRDVAIKIVHHVRGTTGDGGAALARVIREARAASRLNHPGAVTVHDLLETGGQLCIVMELVEGHNLRDVVERDGPLPSDRVAAIGLQLLEVLEAAHRAGIVHRDVKPANVMLLPGDRAKLADFGIATLAGDPSLTSSGSVIGSPRYMAPEQASGGGVGPATDWWGLAATLYFAVEGRPPYDRDGAAAVLGAVLTQPTDPCRLAGPLTPTLTATLTREPADRPSAAVLRSLLGLAASTAPAEVDVRDDAADRTGSLAPPAPAATLSGITTVTSDGVERATRDVVRGPAGDRPEPVACETIEPSDETVPAALPAVAVRSPGQPPGQPVPGQPVPESLLTERSGPGRPASEEPMPARRSGRPGLTAVLAALCAVLAVTSVGLGVQLLGANSGNTRVPGLTSGSIGTSTAGSAAAASGGAASQAGSSTGDALAPLAPDATVEGLGTGSAGRDGLRPVTGSATTAPGQTLPRFSTSVTDPAGGYAVAVPNNWHAYLQGPTTYVEWQDATFKALFEVRAFRATDPAGRLARDEARFRTEHGADGYQQLRLTDRWTYAGRPAAAWEFLWTLDGTQLHALVVAFTIGPRTYTVLYRSADLWWNGGGSATFPTDFERGFHATT